MSVQPSTQSPPAQNLRANSIGLPGVLFQSITTMAPASAVAFSLGPAVAFTGGALPLAALIALIVCALIALNIGAMAKHLPSAGGYFTFVSRGLGPQAGWMTGWLFDLAYLLVVPFQLLVLGPVADQFVNTYFHLSFGPSGWAIWAVIFAIVIFLLTYFGIKISADTGVVLGCIEIGVFVLLSIWLIINAGGHNTLAIFNPTTSSSGVGGVLVGILFVFTAFAGFESSAPLAEETQNPRRTVPRAILLAAICIGAFYILCSYAGITGWTLHHKIGDYGSELNPWATMAKELWGPLELIVLLVILNSALANSNAGVNAVTRVLYAMGRVRTLPSALSHLNRHQVPDLALIFTMIVAVVIALATGFAFGPFPGAFAFVGAVLTFPILIVYIATCVSVFFFYRREHPDEFNVGRHVIIPLIPLIVLLFVLYYQVIGLTTPPLNLVIPIVVAWIILGIIIVVALSMRAPRALAMANRVYGEEEEVNGAAAGEKPAQA
jgi:amino acid transporter